MGGNKKKKNKSKHNEMQRSESDQHFEDQSDHLDDESNEIEPHDEINTSNVSYKRQYDDDDSDHEDQPKRKKKKKQPIVEDTTDKKGKKSIRQMKREKFAQRQAEAQSAAKDQMKSQCLHYLSEWKHNKQNWKFMKTKQLWLFKNKFATNLLPDSSWPLLLAYFESAQGNIRKMLLDDAKKVINQMDEWTESHAEQNTEENDIEDESETNKKPDANVYKRARDLIQCLEE